VWTHLTVRSRAWVGVAPPVLHTHTQAGTGRQGMPISVGTVPFHDEWDPPHACLLASRSLRRGWDAPTVTCAKLARNPADVHTHTRPSTTVRGSRCIHTYIQTSTTVKTRLAPHPSDRQCVAGGEGEWCQPSETVPDWFVFWLRNRWVGAAMSYRWQCGSLPFQHTYVALMVPRRKLVPSMPWGSHRKLVPTCFGSVTNSS
jgi:hypothetical protein